MILRINFFTNDQNFTFNVRRILHERSSLLPKTLSTSNRNTQMLSIRWIALGTALSTILFIGIADAGQRREVQNTAAANALAASPLSATALEAIYSGRTWKWKDGGGFFSGKKNRFIAWSRNGRAWSYGQGRWYATNNGKLCMQAYWLSKTGGGSDTSCFLHRQKDGVIYQKRNLTGDWYVFQSNPPRSTDEAAKVVKGDLVSKGLARLKSETR